MNAESYTRAVLILKTQGYGDFISAKYLLVEGGTDAAFIKRLKIKEIQCIAVGGNKEKVRKRMYRLTGKNVKDLIAENRAKKSVLNIVREFSGEGYYGLVDRDFDTNLEIQRYHKNILITPTHDLETLLLSTDGAIFEAPREMREAFKNALYLAYLIGRVREFLQKRYYKFREHERDEEDYGQFIDVREKEIKLCKLIDFLLKPDGLERNKRSHLENEINQAVLDKDDAPGEDELYAIANGHDISNIMKLLCGAEIEEFVRSHNAECHDYRSVEFAVIDEYDLKKFKGCKLYEDMTKMGLVPMAV